MRLMWRRFRTNYRWLRQYGYVPADYTEDINHPASMGVLRAMRRALTVTFTEWRAGFIPF